MLEKQILNRFLEVNTMNISTIKENGPFFRGKVIINTDDRMDGRIGVYIPIFHSHMSNDENGYGNTHLGEVTNPNYIIAAPMLGINQSEKDATRYQAFSGKYAVPRKGSYVVVFFLNNDPMQCFYFPKEFSLPYPDQRIQGMNLDMQDKLDFYDIYRKVNMDIKEEYNGTISGWNFNDDVNEWFLIFDNGSELRFGSPIETINNDSQNRESNKNKPSFLKLLLQRKDSLFRAISSLFTSQEDSQITLRVEQNKLSEGGVEGNYPSKSSPQAGFLEQKLYINSEGLLSLSDSKFDSLVNDLENKTAVSISDKEVNTHNITSIRNKNVDESSTSEEKITQSNSTREVTKIIELIKQENDKIHQIRTEQSQTHDFQELLSRITHTLSNESSNLITEKASNITPTTFSDRDTVILEDNKDRNVSLTKTEKIDDNEVSYDLNFKRNYTSDTDSWVEARHGISILNDVVKLIQSMKDEKYETSFTMQGKEDEGHKINMRSSFITPNPADKSKVLGLPPISERGYDLTMETTDKKTKVSLESVGKVNGVSGPPAIPLMGGGSKIEWEQEGTEHKVTIELKGANPIGGIQFQLTTKDNKVLLELPSGDVEIKAPLGDVSVTSNTARIEATKSVEVKSAIDAKIEATNVTVTAKLQANIEALTATVKAKSRLLLDAPIINFGSSAINPLVLGLPFMTWAMSHVHVTTSLGSPTTPSVVPPANALSTKVFSA